MTNQRVMTEPAGRELAAQLKALVTGAPAASFLAAHPPKSIYWTTDPSNPAAKYGGTWESLPTMGGCAWVRTDPGASNDGATEQFLFSHPVGSIFWTADTANPAAKYGGSWTSLPTNNGAFAWKRTA